MNKNTNELSNELINLMNQQVIHDRQYNLPIPNLWRCESCQVIFQVRGNDCLPYIFKDNFSSEKLLCKQCNEFANSLIHNYQTILRNKRIIGLVHWVGMIDKDEYYMKVDFPNQNDYSDFDSITLHPVTGRLKDSTTPIKIFCKLIKNANL